MSSSSSFRMEKTSMLRIRPVGESRETTSSEDTPKTSNDPITNDLVVRDESEGFDH